MTFLSKSEAYSSSQIGHIRGACFEVRYTAYIARPLGLRSFAG